MSFFIWLSSALVPFSVFYIVGFGLLAKRPVFDDFLAGAREGMKTTADIFPTLAGLLVAVGALRASGFLDFIGQTLKGPAAFLGFPSELAPLSILRLVSNSAATGLMLDIFKEYGPDSVLGLTASLLLSSTETVFYCLSVYFGSIGIRKTRYALTGALFATAAGFGVSVYLGRILFIAR
ncbi:MAG: spore maturation protein [Lachnospiraceae bacterium]|nr:spore maturation protein [Lachnospiraceae bacterium]